MFRNTFPTLLPKKHPSLSFTRVEQLCTSMSNLILSYTLEEQMKVMEKEQSDANTVSIYRVPSKLRKVEPEAYDPQFISIGPYHHGVPSLQTSERLKLRSLDRLVGSVGGLARNELGKLIDKLGTIEEEARGCYSNNVGQISRDDFVQMMLLDGCFIIQLFRDLKKSNFAHSPLLLKRWMLPVVRRDLISLENQLPMIVLQKIFDETRVKIETTDENETSLEELALRFFDPLMPREPYILMQGIKSCAESKHLLDLFHSSISLGDRVKRCKEPHMYRSVSELKEAGIKVRVLQNSEPLKLTFHGFLRGGVLKMARLQVDDHTGSFFRNIVAYEQCHQGCKPDMTTYIFFLDKLINSAEDVGLLHYGGVIQHSLGSNKQLAKLVNKLCVEVEHDGQESYLCEVVECLNSYSNQWCVKVRAKLKHDYFTNLWVGLSTFAAVLLIYLTLLQTTCDVVGDRTEDELGMWYSLNLFLVHPIEEVKDIICSIGTSILEAIARNDPPSDDPSQCG